MGARGLLDAHEGEVDPGVIRIYDQDNGGALVGYAWKTGSSAIIYCLHTSFECDVDLRANDNASLLFKHNKTSDPLRASAHGGGVPKASDVHADWQSNSNKPLTFEWTWSLGSTYVPQ